MSNGKSVSKGQPPEIRSLTGLRFVAAAYVFMFHVEIRWPLPVAPFLAHLIGNGAAGMSLFFILSGYVLAYRYDGKPIDLRGYFWSRVGRIYPVYCVAAILALPGLYWSLTAHHSPVHHAIAKLLTLVVADGALVQAWIPPAFNYWNNGGSWSISVEAFFYVLFPALMPLIFGFKRPLLLLVALYFAALLPGFAWYAFHDEPAAGLTVFYQMPIFRLAEFCIGITGYVVGRRWDGRGADAIFLAALGALILALGLRATTDVFVTNDWIVVPVMGALVAVAGSARGFFAGLLATRPFVQLGRWSYCFYSFQFALLIGIGYVRSKSHVLDSPVLILIGGFVTLTAISGLGYHFIEEPLRRRVTSYGRKRQMLAVRSEAPAMAGPAT